MTYKEEIDYREEFYNLVNKLEDRGYEFEYDEISGAFCLNKYISSEDELEDICVDSIYIVDEYVEEYWGGTDWQRAYYDLKKECYLYNRLE